MCPMSSTSPCKVAAAADAILEQSDAFLARVPADCYAKASPALGGGTIGQHARHILDHFRAALTTPACDPIDYDHRERGGRAETDPDAARAEIERLRDLVRTLDEAAMATEVTARVMLTGSGETADLGSTLGRELFFATHHAIHHHAMMKSIGAGFGVACPDGFGAAPSTINYQNADA
ncbi:MAG: DinB family protein [Phycisphaerales bacterium]|nr:DinB family protein [Planctomycetota bacterium]MCH8509152.1 DinB family protein [Phycisphaerales bacterium]